MEETLQNTIDNGEQVQTKPAKRRVWEVDFLRGFMILFVVFDHFMWDVNNFGADYSTALFRWLYDLSERYYSGVLRTATHDTFVMMFVLLSGVSCSFSKNNLMRAVKMISFAILLTVVTTAFDMAINFNVIHVIALSVLIYCGLQALGNLCKSKWSKSIYGWAIFAITLTVLVFGYCFQYVADNYRLYGYLLGRNTSPTTIGIYIKDFGWLDSCVTSENKVWFFLYQHANSAAFSKFWGGDYLAFLPAFGWFMIGTSLGKLLYKDKTTLFPSFNEKIVCPITFCGRYSIWVYFGTQGLMYALFYLFRVLLV